MKHQRNFGRIQMSDFVEHTEKLVEFVRKRADMCLEVDLFIYNHTKIPAKVF